MNNYKKYYTWDEAIKGLPHLKFEIQSKVSESKFQKGDVLIEDRSKWIGTSQEAHCDRAYPEVCLEVLEVRKDLGLYWLWNLTRNINTVGVIQKVDSKLSKMESPDVEN